MNGGLPEIGSKISLISKADIRYEGRLFTLDPQECTIALSSVRSFGTEDRETRCRIPAQNQVYDYILFRGTDIKDIKVVNSVSLNDPAIMQMSMPPMGQQPFQQSFQHMGQVGQFGFGHMGPMAGVTGATGLAAGMGMNQDPRVLSKPSSVVDFLVGSRSTTPASLGSRKSPTNDQGVQVNSKRGGRKVIHPIQPPSQRNAQQRERNDSRGENQMDNKNIQNRSNVTNHRNPNNQQQHQRQMNWPQRGQIRQRGRPRGGYKTPGQPNQQAAKSKALKFENDFDFEQANTKFEELRSQLAKIKLEDGKTEVNGDSDKKDDSGNETGAGETEQEEEHEVFYDKSKSFFDNISCEAVERSKGRSQRTDWRTERKLNSETFGVSATRRGNYRGRGGYRGGAGGGYRGGIYRGGYRNDNVRRLQGKGNLPQQQQQQQPPNNQQQEPSTSSNSTNNQKKPPEPVPAVQVAK